MQTLATSNTAKKKMIKLLEGQINHVTVNSFLHFNNNLERPEDCKDKLYKVRPLIDSVFNKSRQL